MQVLTDAGSLRKRGKPLSDAKLLPIDHGLILPSTLDVSYDHWCWLGYSQLQKEIVPAVREYIMGIDVEKDVTDLRELFSFNDSVLWCYRAVVTALQLGVEQGMTLYEIAM